MDFQRLTFVTTLGVMDCPASTAPAGGTDITAAANVQWCQVWTSSSNSAGETAANGNAVISLKAGGREGTATVTISHGTLDPTSVDVTFFGTAKNMTAEADQGSVEVGGSVFVVLTVTDGVGNPVKNVQPQPAGTDPIEGPTDDANEVTTSQAADDGDAATSPYNVNKDVDGDGTIDTGDIPACGPVTAVAADPNDDTVIPMFASTGTNNSGQCVVEVNATPDDTTTTTNEASARGVHTLNFELGDVEASVEITVAGAAATIESDAPEYVEPLSDTTITVAVRDDEGVLVGETAINVIKVAGDGLAEGKATEAGAMTTNGSATFSYAAGLAGDVVFRVIAGTGSGAVRDIITLTVGEPEPEEPPAPASTLTVQGNLGSFSGGSLEDFSAAVEAACPGGAVIWVQASDGSWPAAYSSTAPAFANAGFHASFSGGFDGNTLVWVEDCS